MAKKYRPKKTTEEKLDDIVKHGLPKEQVQKKKQNDVYENKPVERVTNGYRIRKDYVKKVSLLSNLLDMKKFEVVEKGLEMIFEEHKELLKKFDI